MTLSDGVSTIIAMMPLKVFNKIVRKIPFSVY
jgi:hypothetical protein